MNSALYKFEMRHIFVTLFLRNIYSISDTTLNEYESIEIKK